MKPIDEINRVADKTYLAGEAGSFSVVPARTLGFWAERGLVVADTTGTGDKRRFTALQVVEIACIQRLSKLGLSLKKIKGVMDYLRSGHKLRKYLHYDHLWIIIPIFPEGPGIKYTRVISTASIVKFFHNEGEPLEEDKRNYLVSTVLNDDTDHTVVLNIGRIVREVLAKF